MGLLRARPLGKRAYLFSLFKDSVDGPPGSRGQECR